MSGTGSLTAILAALVLATTTLAGCTTTAPQTADPSKTPSTTRAATVPAGDCTSLARISFGSGSARLIGNLVDRGARDLAAGTVGVDDQGNIVSYTVATGDAPLAIGERLCIENAWALAELDHTRTIHPNQELRLTPDPDVLWVPYYNPDDAPEGFQQIPYQRAIEAMGTAADAGDLDILRQMFS